MEVSDDIFKKFLKNHIEKSLLTLQTIYNEIDNDLSFASLKLHILGEHLSKISCKYNITNNIEND